jgi:Amidohydrolase family
MLLGPPPPLSEVPSSSCRLGDVSVDGIPGRTVVVDHGAITEIREARPDDDRRYAGCFVTPGLIDSHQHLPPASPLKLSGLYCLLYLMHGVTTVLDAGDGDGTAVPAARRLIAAGAIPGPRVVSVGPFIARPPRQWTNTVLVEDPVAPAVIVQQALDRGAQAIKLYEGLTRSDIEGISAAARERGLLVLGHVPAALDIEEAGVPEVQHFFGVPTAKSRGGAPQLLKRLADWHAVDDARLDAVVEASTAKGIAHTPTLVVSHGVLQAQQDSRDEPLMPRLFPAVIWHPKTGISTYRSASQHDISLLRESLPVKLELVNRLHHAGVRLYAGTDVGQPFTVPGKSLQRELHLFADAGIPAAGVIDIATARSGERLRIPKLGTIAAGAPADMLVLERNPYEDLSALSSMRAVVSNGHLLDMELLRAAVDRQLGHYRGLLVDRAGIIGAHLALRRLPVLV